MYKLGMKVFVFLCIIFVCACNKDDTAEKWAKEEADLKVWISENAPKAELIESGIYFELIRKNDAGIEPETGDHVLVNFICSFLDGTVEQVSYKDETTTPKPMNHSTYREGGPELWSSDYWTKMGVELMREKEKANIYIPSRMIGLRDFKSRKFEIELVRVIADLKTYQEDIMTNYMEKKFSDDFDTEPITINGRELLIFFHIDNSEAGDDEVNVSSVSTLHNEYYYLQDNDPRFCVHGRAKTGWDKKFENIFQSAKKGGTITAMMPYRVMYGENPYIWDDTKQFIAPLGSVLKYEIYINP